MGFSCDYLLVGLGGALFDGLTAAWIAGLLMLILAAAAIVLVILRRQGARQIFLVGRIAYVLTTLCAITIGRSGHGVDQALSSRYATLTIPLVIACYVLSDSPRQRQVSVGGHFCRLRNVVPGDCGHRQILS